MAVISNSKTASELRDEIVAELVRCYAKPGLSSNKMRDTSNVEQG